MLHEQSVLFLAFAQRLFRPRTFDRFPASIHGKFDEADLFLRPIPGNSLMHGHHRAQFAFLQERTANQSLDADCIEHVGAGVSGEFRIHIAENQ